MANILYQIGMNQTNTHLRGGMNNKKVRVTLERILLYVGHEYRFFIAPGYLWNFQIISASVLNTQKAFTFSTQSVEFNVSIPTVVDNVLVDICFTSTQSLNMFELNEK